MTTATITALDIITRFLADDEDRVSFPVDTPALLTKMGVETLVCTFPGGVTVQPVDYIAVREEGETPKVYVSTRFFGKGQRVMFAEALGAIIQYLDTTERFGIVENRVDDRQLSVFAEELLMPGFAVRKYWAKGDSLKKIARKFGVSERHLENRVANLGLFGMP